MNRTVLRALASHWLRNPLQLMSFLLGIALATALWSGVQAINAEARASTERAAASVRILDLPRLETQSGAPLTVEDFAAMRREGVLVSPILSGEVALTEGGARVKLIGIEPLTAPQGVWPGGPLVGEGGFEATQILVAPDAEPGPGLVPHAAVPPDTALADIAVAQQRLNRTDFDALLVAAEQPLGAPDPLGLRPDLKQVARAPQTDAAALTKSFQLNLTAFGALCFLVGLFITRGTVGLTMAQRAPLVSTLRALGVPVGRLATLMVLELSLLALIAGAVGVVLGYIIATLLTPGVARTVGDIYGLSLSGRVQIRPVWWLGGLGLAVIGTMVAALGPLLRTTSVVGEGALSMGPVIKWLGVALCALALVLGLTATTLEAGFGAIAALLLGGACLVPSGLRLLVRLLAPLRQGALGNWFVGETRAQIDVLSLAMTAMLLALVANIGVTTMVSSFRTSFDRFLDHRLAAELYISEPADPVMLEAILEPDERLLPIRALRADVAAQPVQIYGVVDDATYREDWELIRAAPDAWDQVYNGAGAVINEQLHHRSGLDLGDRVTLPDGPATVAGIIADYGNPLGQVLISDARFDRLAPDIQPRSYAIRTSRPEGLQARLIAAGIDRDAVSLQDEVKSLSLRTFERTFAVTDVLNGFTLAVAALSILTTLLTVSDMRVPRLAPLWAMGVMRGWLAGAELGRIAVLTALTAFLALPFGLVLAWMLLDIVNVAAFGWALPFVVAPFSWVRLILLGVLASLVAALWPAVQLVRLSPRRILEVFSRDQ